jgi:hypothetical protein
LGNLVLLQVVKKTFIENWSSVVNKEAEGRKWRRYRRCVSKNRWEYPLQGQRKGIVMRRALIAALATVAIGYATPALAGVTLDTLNGNLSTKIKADQGDGLTHDVVYGTDGVTSKDVSFDGNVDIAITGGSGFAEIDPGKGVTNFTQLVIDPLYNFIGYEFAFQTLDDASVTVEYMLASGGGWQTITLGGQANPILQAANGNNNYLVSSTDPLTELRLTSNVGFKMVKQNAIILAPDVPEPGTWALMLLGFGGVGLAMRRSRKRQPGLMQIA